MAGPFGLEIGGRRWRHRPGGAARRPGLVRHAGALVAAGVIFGAFALFLSLSPRDAGLWELLSRSPSPAWKRDLGDLPADPADFADGSARPAGGGVFPGEAGDGPDTALPFTAGAEGPPAPPARLFPPLALAAGLAAALGGAFLLGRRLNREGSSPPASALLLERADLEGRAACLTDRKGRLRALNATARALVRTGGSARPPSATQAGTGPAPASRPPPRDVAAFLALCLPGDRAPHPGTLRRILLAGRRINLPLGEPGEERLAVLPVGRQRLLWEITARLPHPGSEANGARLAAPVLVVNRSGSILSANPAAEALIGPLPAHLESLVPDRPLRPHGVHPVRTHQGVKPMRIISLAGAGGLRHLHLFPVDDAESMAAGLESVIDRLPIPLLKLAPDGRILHANRAATALLGMAARPDLPLGDIFEGPGMPVSRWIARALGSDAGLPPETVRFFREGKEGHLRVSLVRGLENGKPFLLAHLHDTTALKQMEAQLAQSQRMHAIGQLAGGIAHDFNNLLAILSAHAETLLDHVGSADAAARARIGEMRATIERGARLVRRILAFSRRQPMMLRPVRPGVLIEEVTGLLAPLLGRGIDLVIEAEPNDVQIEADPAALEQIIINIAVNARDAMNGTGELHIAHGTLVLDGPARLTGAPTSLPAGRWAIIRLRDTGPGLPEGNIDRLFEPFFTTKPPGRGTGLGLAMCYGLMKQMGGYIFARNHPEGGAEFLLCLPVCGDEVEKAGREERAAAPHRPAQPLTERQLPTEDGPLPARGAPTAAQEEERCLPFGVPKAAASFRLEAPPAPVPRAPPFSVSASAGRIIVVVEDEAPLRRFIRRCLECEGHHVLAFESGEEALRHLVGIQGASPSPAAPAPHGRAPVCDLVISDITLPGCDGPSWIAQYRKALKAGRKAPGDGRRTGAAGTKPQAAQPQPEPSPPTPDPAPAPPATTRSGEGRTTPHPARPGPRPGSRPADPLPEPKVIFMSGGGAEPSGETTSLPAGCRFMQKPFDRKTLLDEVRQALAQGPPPPR